MRKGVQPENIPFGTAIFEWIYSEVDDQSSGPNPKNSSN
jgi:hypothetical protein